MASRVHAFQIFYNDATRAAVDPAFQPLDNSANERPDWYEYWPIRRFFHDNFQRFFVKSRTLIAQQVVDNPCVIFGDF